MSDYPMLISNKLHSFRNFVFTYFPENSSGVPVSYEGGVRKKIVFNVAHL